VARIRQLIETLAGDAPLCLVLAPGDDIDPPGSGQEVERLLVTFDVLVWKSMPGGARESAAPVWFS
jgi:hypothetical protein